MPPSLPGSSLGTAASSSASPATPSPRSNATGARSDRRDFDALLKADGGNKDAPAKGAADKHTPDNASSSPGDATRRPAADAPSEASDPAATPATAATDKPTSSDPTDDTDTSPWPPLGLAGLALAGVEAVTVMAAPAANADTALANAAPALPVAQAAPANPLTAPALPGVDANSATSTWAPLALPADALVSEDTAVPDALADAIANAAGDADAPTTPFLHALNAAAELKAAATASTPFQGEPTATPHIGGDDFDDAMSARIGWLADQKIGHATVKVTPHDLGLIEVRLQMDGDKVHATFSSAHADVRHALESSIPRLREMLNDQGFQLGNADVGHQQTAQDGKNGSGNPAHDGSESDLAMTETIVSPAQLMRQRGLVDAYA